MKKIIFLSVNFLLWIFIACSLSAQVYSYEDMPTDVKDQMNKNKQSGLPVWKDILFAFSVKVTGVEKNEKQIIIERASKKTEIISINFEGDDLVIVECEGGTNFDSIKSIFSSLVSNITNIENNASVKHTGEK